ncbi:metallopeptidase family protein [Neoactinobaculum massilliense]|uniref:metallopeptidase family protein n=1 Tax=Neoactinobaculum massilliense TaxID=2364794 RepID=UPI000F51E0CD|nr:metallopeptidase family protein [Neoactinobaculum massilliense]
MRDVIPPRSQGRRRDRHGRGLRGPVLPFSLPAWRTRGDQFADVIAYELAMYRHRLPELQRMDFGVMNVPDQDPAPWEERSPLARYLPFERGGKLDGRIVFYRWPIQQEAAHSPEPRIFLHYVVTDAVAAAIGSHPEDIDWMQS